MSKYLKMIPLMLYPYAYLVPLIILFFTPAVGDNMEKVYLFTFIYAIFLHILVLFIAIYNSIVCAKSKKYDALISARINMLTKCIQIPAYIFHFCLGLLGLVMSIWGIGIIMFVVLVDLLTIILTGISSIGCSVRMKKENIINKKMSIIFGIGSFIYCIDIGIAIYYFIKANIKKKLYN